MVKPTYNEPLWTGPFPISEERSLLLLKQNPLFKAHSVDPGLKVIKNFTGSPQLSMKFFTLILLAFYNDEQESSIIGLSEPKKKIS